MKAQSLHRSGCCLSGKQRKAANIKNPQFVETQLQVAGFFYTKQIARAGEELKRLHWCEAQALDVNYGYFLVSLVWVMMAPFLLDTEKMRMISSDTIVNVYIDISKYVYVDIICIYFQYIMYLFDELKFS